MLNLNQFLKRLESYEGISECIRSYSTADIMLFLSQVLNISETDLARKPMGGYSKGKTSGAYWFVLNDLKTNIDYYDWLYNRLEDDESKRVFGLLTAFRLSADKIYIKNAYDGKHPQYFDTSIVTCDENEVFVDCGGYIGDTVQSYIDTYGKYKKCSYMSLTRIITEKFRII